MAEEFELTDPIVVENTTTKYKVRLINLDLDAIAPNETETGVVQIRLRDNNNVSSFYQYVGAEATDLMKWLNTANFSVNSMQKRVLQKLDADGKLPPGTVVGAPDPPVVVFEE